MNTNFSSETPVANIVCMKWGKKYGPEYVNRLYAMVKRNITRPFRFVCYTDDGQGIVPEVSVMPLPEYRGGENHAVGAYRKKSLCRGTLAPFQQGERFIYLDLDLVIMGNIDDMFDYAPDKDFVICYNWTRGNGKIGNSSVTMMRVGPLDYIIEDLEKDFATYRAQFGTASQEYMSSKVIEKYGALAFWPDAWCKSFQHHCLPSRWLRAFKAPAQPPAETKILLFHGAINPPDAIQGVWPGTYPLYKRWYKRLLPCPWLAPYWQ